jgi:homoserine O-acetyltransferase
MDTHDIARGRSNAENDSDALAEVLSRLPPKALVIGIQSDGLFMTSEQREIAEHIEGSELIIINSPDGHDGFLLEFEQINGHVSRYLRKELAELYVGQESDEVQKGMVFSVQKTSVFGEAESSVDVTMW